MRFNFSRNPISRFSCWFHNHITEPMNRTYYRNKKTHYVCSVCGLIIAPYFEADQYTSVTDDYGWCRFKNSKRWVCHHCAYHGFALSTEPQPRCKTWDEWHEFVLEDNARLFTKIKAKDPEYYEYWFEGGYERELFGDDEDE